MPDCESLPICPFFNDGMYEMAEGYKERHYKGDYIWCDRYTGFKTLENGLERKNYVKNRKNSAYQGISKD